LKRNIQLDDWISQAEAARMRGITGAGIVSLIKRGRLETLEIAGKVLVSRKQIEEFVPRRGGRPRKNVAGADSLKAQTETKKK
jgi:hypothetical protein